ncbi:hypothetical protein [Pseudanabaena sp. 'Roaring Creek']|uniref:hypothetical protein n=1 Tax=Pseudanabaena sp. 'Roaring Creek' TaxID=1681830 RepID=UPI0006D846C1|nr:hypothetical protein [Pseudanabaena sp. 'Roaring Creek']
MRKLFFVAVVVATVSAGCGSGIKDQIKGKWEQVAITAGGETCIKEYVDKFLTSDCYLKGEHLFSSTINYEITSDNRIVFISDKGVKNIIDIKIDGDEMQMQNLDKDRWVKYKRIK